MKLIAFLTIPLLLANHAAFAGSIDGNGDLALAGLVAEHSPNVNPSDKISLAKFLNGQSNAPSSLNKKITVAAGKASSERSDWDAICKSFCPTIGVNVAGRVKKIVVEHPVSMPTKSSTAPIS